MDDPLKQIELIIVILNSNIYFYVVLFLNAQTTKVVEMVRGGLAIRFTFLLFCKKCYNARSIPTTEIIL